MANPFADFSFKQRPLTRNGWTRSTPGSSHPDEADCTATAMQDSILSTAGLDILSFVHVDGGSNLDSDGFPTINADALSLFQVSSSVTAPVVFNLSLFDSRGYITGVGSTYDHTIDFSSDISGSIVHVRVNGQADVFQRSSPA